MIKKIAIIAVATIVWGGVTASALNENSEQTNKQCTEECCKEKNGDNK